MGMYTEIQGTIKFDSAELAQAFVTSWNAVRSLVPQAESFVNYSRSHWIPNSGDGVKGVVGTVVQFHSELKDYDHTIDKFLELVPFLSDSWCLETRYEECSSWTLHRNGEENIYVNGDKYHEREWNRSVDEEEYPDFDVFDLGNLK